MKVNVTIRLEKAILDKARAYATPQKISFNELVKNLLTKNVETNGYDVLMDIATSNANNNSTQNWQWNRDALYEEEEDIS